MTDHMYCNCTELNHSSSCPYRTDADRESDARRYQQDRADKAYERNGNIKPGRGRKGGGE